MGGYETGSNVFFDPSGLAPTYEEAIELDPQDDNPHGWKWDPRDPSSPYHHRWKKEQENKKRREVYRQRRARADKLKEPFEDAERREYERRKEYIDETRRKLESGRCVIVKIITGEEDKWWDCMASCMNIPVQVLKAGGKKALKHWLKKKGMKAAAKHLVPAAGQLMFAKDLANCSLKCFDAPKVKTVETLLIDVGTGSKETLLVDPRDLQMN